MKENKILQEDAEKILNTKLDLSDIDGKSVFITGATGLIGSSLVRALMVLNNKKQKDINVIALVRDKEKAEQMFSEFIVNRKLEIVCNDINKHISLDKTVDYVIHCASVTDSASFVKQPVETIETTLNGLKNILDFSKEKNVAGLVYLSSMEVYGVTNPDLETISEIDYGYLNPMEVRSSYSEGKRMAECICKAYAEQYKMNIKIVRLVQTFGSGVKYNDNRVFAQFARSVIERRDIILHTKGETTRSYCYISDAVEGILYVLLRGVGGEAYNLANTSATISIYDMAKMLADKYEHTEVVIQEADVKKMGYNPVVKMKMNTDKIQSLGWTPCIGIEEAFERLIESMRINRN